MGLTQSTSSDYESSADYPWVKTKIEEDPVVMFSKTTCPFCTRAKRLLENHSIKYSVHELDRMSNGSSVQDVLLGMTGARTVTLCCMTLSQCLPADTSITVSSIQSEAACFVLTLVLCCRCRVFL